MDSLSQEEQDLSVLLAEAMIEDPIPSTVNEPASTDNEEPAHSPEVPASPPQEPTTTPDIRIDKWYSTGKIPVNSHMCWHCTGLGHKRRNCPSKYRAPHFCSRCGQKGVLSRDCQCPRTTAEYTSGYPILKIPTNPLPSVPSTPNRMLKEPTFASVPTQSVVPTTTQTPVPVTNLTCWKCGKEGHTRWQCLDNGNFLIFCSRCGKRNILSRNCPCRIKKRGSRTPDSTGVHTSHRMQQLHPCPTCRRP